MLNLFDVTVPAAENYNKLRNAASTQRTKDNKDFNVIYPIVITCWGI